MQIVNAPQTTSLTTLIKTGGKHKNIRHGDVRLRRVKSLNEVPAAEKLLKTNSTTVAEGEMTGHSHQLRAKGAAAQFQIYANLDNPDQRFIAVENGEAELVHEEHKTVPVEAGLWEISIEQEYDPFKNVRRRVVD